MQLTANFQSAIFLHRVVFSRHTTKLLVKGLVPCDIIGIILVEDIFQKTLLNSVSPRSSIHVMNSVVFCRPLWSSRCLFSIVSQSEQISNFSVFGANSSRQAWRTCSAVWFPLGRGMLGMASEVNAFSICKSQKCFVSE